MYGKKAINNVNVQAENMFMNNVRKWNKDFTIEKTFQWIIGHRYSRVAKTYDEIRMLDKSQKQNEQPCVLNVKIAIIILKDFHVLKHSTSVFENDI